MKKELVYNFDCYRNLKEIESLKVVQPDIEMVEQLKSASDALIREIYALDPISKLPTGDIGYYVSDKANPEIKEFILKNLLMDTSSAANATIPDGIDSELAMDLMRKADETPEMYKERLNSFALDNVKFAQTIYENSKQSVKYDTNVETSEAV